MALEEVDNEDLITGLTSKLPLTELLPRGYLSVSQVNQYMKCGKAYEFRYLLDRQVRPNSYTAQGSALHKGAEQMHLFMKDTPELPPKAFVEQAYVDAHEQYFAPDLDVEIMEDDVSVGAVKDLGVKMINHYYEGAAGNLAAPDSKESYRRVYPVHVERKVYAMLKTQEGKEVPFLGVIDLEEHDAVADLKTKRKIGTQGEADNSLQLSLYAYVTGKTHVRLDQLIKPTKTLGVRYIRRESDRTAEEIAHAVDIAAQVADDIVAGRFYLTMPDNWWCSVDWCPYWNECRGRKRASNIIPAAALIRSSTDAVTP